MKVALAIRELHHVEKLRRVEQRVREGRRELCARSHADSHFRDPRRALAQQAERGQPWRRGAFRHVLAQADTHGVVILRHIAVDVVQAPIADLDIDAAAEEQL